VFEKLKAVSITQNQSLPYWSVANLYSTDLNDAAWALVSPLLPPAGTGSRSISAEIYSKEPGQAVSRAVARRVSSLYHVLWFGAPLGLAQKPGFLGRATGSKVPVIQKPF
jgi:hypothetical protein